MSVRAQFEHFWQALSSKEQALLCAYFPFRSLFFYEFALYLYGALILGDDKTLLEGEQQDWVRALFDRLREHGWLQALLPEEPTDVVYFHPCVNQFLSRQISSEQRENTVASYIGYYEALAAKTFTDYDQGRDADSRLGDLWWVEAEKDNLFQVVEWSIRYRSEYSTVRAHLKQYFLFDKREQEYLYHLDSWLALFPLAVKGKALHHLTYLWMEKGQMHSRLKQDAEARNAYEQASQLAERFREEPYYQRISPLLQQQLGQTTGSRQSPPLLVEDENDPAQIRSHALACHDYGFYCYKEDQPQEARLYLDRALELLRQIGDQLAVGRVLHQLGVLVEEEGEAKQAMTYFEEAAAIFEQFEEFDQLAMVQMTRGHLYQQEKAYQKAAKEYKAAMAHFLETEDKMRQSWALFNLGMLHDELGQPLDALGFLLDALELELAVGRSEEDLASTIDFIRDVVADGELQDHPSLQKMATRLQRQFGSDRLRLLD
ncbi:MAG: tetratricopeptide repeat protein [Bacteroidota bacterium]